MSKNYVLIGDSHRQVSKQLERVRDTFPDYKPEETAVILLGDVGLNVYNNKSDWKAKHKAAKFGYTLYCLHGNHENRACNNPNIQWSYDNRVKGLVGVEPEFPNIHYLYDAVSIYQFGNYKCLTVPGAYSVDKSVRLQMGWEWFPDEQLTQEEMNEGFKLAAGQHFDFVLSHTCPYSFVPTHLFLNAVNQSMVDNTMELWMEDLKNVIEYDQWVFGHYHSDEVIKPHVHLIYEKPLAMNDIVSYWNTYDKEGSALERC